jgi:hypothetical protein
MVLDQEACSGATARRTRGGRESVQEVNSGGGSVVEMWNLAARTREIGTTVDRIVAHLHPWPLAPPSAHQRAAAMMMCRRQDPSFGEILRRAIPSLFSALRCAPNFPLAV